MPARPLVAPRSSAPLRLIAFLLLSFGSISCNTDLILEAPVPAALADVQGDGQIAVVGSTLPIRPAVTVRDTKGKPVAGAPVVFTYTLRPSGSAAVETISDARGVATVPVEWTLSTVAGPNVVTVSSLGLPTVTITAIGRPDVPDTLTLVEGQAQSGRVGAPAAARPAARVRDRYGNNVPGVLVEFLPTTGSGTIVGGSAVTTDSLGVARLGGWTFGTAPGTQTLSVRLGALAASASAVVSVGDPARLDVAQGSGQSALIGTTLAVRPRVKVVDAYGNPIAATSVVFRVVQGGGRLADSVAVSDAQGHATAGAWTLGMTGGTHTVRAVVGTVTSDLTALALAPSLLSVVSGGTPSGTVGELVAGQIRIKISDGGQNGVPNLPLDVAVVAGGGSLASSTVTTDASGEAVLPAWRLGTTSGLNRVRVTYGTLSLEISATAAAAAPSSVAAVDTTTQVGAVNAAVAVRPSVRILDSFGNGVAGVSVVFTVASGGGSLTGATVTTDSLGVATVGSWTLGQAAGLNTLSTTVAGQTVTFRARATAGAARTLSIVAGNAQTTSVGTAVDVAPAVRVFDAFDNPVIGATVTFAPLAGNGTVTGGTVTTDSTGRATVGTWTLGTTVGTQTLRASIGEVTADFTATGTAEVAAEFRDVRGDGQVATVATAVTTMPSVQVTDRFGNPIGGIVVTFTFQLRPSGSVQVRTTTGADGRAALTADWILSTMIGPNLVTVSAPGITPQTLTAIGIADSPDTLQIVSGNSQTATVATAVATAPVISLRDQYGNPVASAPVEFTIVAGGGSVVGSATVRADTNGVATLGGWTLGSTAGPQTLRATAGERTIDFAATGIAAEASTLEILGGESQTAVAAQPLANPVRVRVRDAFANPWAGRAVTFAVASGSGSVATVNAVTDSTGIASSGTWTLGTAAGTQTLNISAETLTSTVTATATPGAASGFGAVIGDNQTVTVNTVVPTRPAITVVDQFGNSVAGIPVTFTFNLQGGGTVSFEATSNTQGIATVPADWRVRQLAGANTITATAPTINATPVTITAIGVADVPTQMTVQGGNNQSATVGTAVATAPAVLLKDQYDNLVGGATVTYTVLTGGGSVTGDSAVSDSTGVAAVSAWTLGTTAGSNTLRAAVGDLTTTFTATGTAGAGAALTLVSGGSQTADVSSALTNPVIVKFADQYGNAVSGATVTFSASGGGSVANASVTTGADGQASSGSWTLGSSAGTQTLTATSGAITLAVTATATAANNNNNNNGPTLPVGMAVYGGDNQYAIASTAVLTPPSVSVADSAGAPISGVVVTFAVTAGGGSITGATATTDANGIARVGSWTLGASGTQTLTASATGYTDVAFTANVNALPLNVTAAEKLPNGTQQFTVSGGTAPYTWSVNGVVGGDNTYGTITSGGFFTAPATVPSPATYPVCVTDAANQVSCVNMTISTTPSAGGELIVINDINWGDLGFAGYPSSMTYPGNRRFVQNLVNFAPTGTRATATKVWFFNEGGNSGANHMPNSGFSNVAAAITAEGFTVESKNQHRDLETIPSDVKVIFLMMPGTTFAKAEYNALKTFASEGGRIVYVGENGGYYSYGLTLQDTFIRTMGGVMTNTGSCDAGGWIVKPYAHQLSTGIGEDNATGFYMNCVSRLNLGPNDYAIFRDPRTLIGGQMTVMVGAAKIDYALIP